MFMLSLNVKWQKRSSLVRWAIFKQLVSLNPILNELLFRLSGFTLFAEVYLMEYVKNTGIYFFI